MILLSLAGTLKALDIAVRWLARGEANLYVAPLNSQGYRSVHDYSPSRRQGVTTRVAIIGDSFTFGWGVRVEEAFPAQLEQMLGDAYEVMNLGVYAAGPRQELRVLRDVYPVYRPDVVVWQVFVNDIGVLRPHADQAPPRGASLPAGLRIGRELVEVALPDLYGAVSVRLHRLGSSLVAQRRTVFNDPGYTYDQWAALYAEDDLPGLGDCWKIFEDEITEAQSYVEHEGGTFIMLVIPDAMEVAESYREMVSSEAWYEISPSVAAAGNMPRHLAAIAKRHGIIMVDVRAELRVAEVQGRTYLSGHFHLTPLGHRVVANRLAQSLRASAR